MGTTMGTPCRTCFGGCTVERGYAGSMARVIIMAIPGLLIIATELTIIIIIIIYYLFNYLIINYNDDGVILRRHTSFIVILLLWPFYSRWLCLTVCLLQL